MSGIHVLLILVATSGNLSDIIITMLIFYCILYECLVPVFSGRSHFKVASFEEFEKEDLRHLFPLDHNKHMLMTLMMIMIVMSLVGTTSKPESNGNQSQQSHTPL